MRVRVAGVMSNFWKGSSKKAAQRTQDMSKELTASTMSQKRREVIIPRNEGWDPRFISGGCVD